jgi:hypothetical protein
MAVWAKQLTAREQAVGSWEQDVTQAVAEDRTTAGPPRTSRTAGGSTTGDTTGDADADIDGMEVSRELERVTHAARVATADVLDANASPEQVWAGVACLLEVLPAAERITAHTTDRAEDRARAIRDLEAARAQVTAESRALEERARDLALRAQAAAAEHRRQEEELKSEQAEWRAQGTWGGSMCGQCNTAMALTQVPPLPVENRPRSPLGPPPQPEAGPPTWPAGDVGAAPAAMRQQFLGHGGPQATHAAGSTGHSA